MEMNRDGDFWQGRSVLITGAGGFVGSALAEDLVGAGAAVTAILRDRPAVPSPRLLAVIDQVNVVYGSITDYPTVERAINEYEVDTCFHLAAQAIVGAANRSPLSTFESNIRGTWTVLEACRRSSPVDRVVVASSDKAYGSQPRLPYTEDMPLLGSTPYDASKACTDVIARCYHATYGMSVAVSRCANIYGGGDANFSRLIPGTFRSVLNRERPIIRSDGTLVRDYIFVSDAVHAYRILGERVKDKGVAGQAFNFGANDPKTVLEVVQSILAICECSDLQPDVQGVGKHLDEIAAQYLDSSRAGVELGWRPSVGLDEGLKQTADWYRSSLNVDVASGLPAEERANDATESSD